MLFKKLIGLNPKKRIFPSYFIHALGELALVVIGILIAVQINNWNESRKERKTEKNILIGIRDNIIQDTIDFNSNISFYEKRIKKDSIVLNHLVNQKEYKEEVIRSLYWMSIQDVSVALQYSYFEEAKHKGLSVISNEKLRNQLRRIYEFHYPQLEMQENEIESLNYYHILYNELSKYFEVDSISLAGPSKKLVFMNNNNYNQILKDKNLHYKIYDTMETKRALMKKHISIRKKVLILLEEINLELN